jgi:CubicO group peptidase (beta-lactamase class C family)
VPAIAACQHFVDSSASEEQEHAMTSLGLPLAERPEQVGLSSERLARITAKINADVERGAIPGAVLAIARSGRIAYGEAIGYRDKETGAAMRLDAIFRIASPR